VIEKISTATFVIPVHIVMGPVRSSQLRRSATKPLGKSEEAAAKKLKAP